MPADRPKRWLGGYGTEDGRRRREGELDPRAQRDARCSLKVNIAGGGVVGRLRGRVLRSFSVSSPRSQQGAGDAMVTVSGYTKGKMISYASMLQATSS